MKGLTETRAREAFERFGPNALPPEPSRSLFSRVAAQLKNALLYLLLFALLADLVAWLMAGALGVPLEALAIFGIIALNAGLGVLQEYRSERALRELARLSAPRAWIERDGAFERLEATLIVPGDLVRLEAGDQVPADGQVVTAEGLTADESILSGESLPVAKAPGDELLSGSLLAHGRALLRVSRTGALSNMGKLASSLGKIDTAQTPLERRINELGRRIAHVVAGLCVFIVVAGLLIQGFEHPLPLLMFAVAFGVAVVPEGMPAMMTLTFALGVQRMARRQAVVRRLAAVEALGAVTVIASDKTGTLTENQLSVRTLDTEAAVRNDAILALVLANDADPCSGAGDPLELSLFAFAEGQGADAAALHRAYPRISSRAFDSEWRCMRATVVTPQGTHRAFLKGAPEALLGRCQLSLSEKESILTRVEALASQGLKVLALAQGSADAEQGLTFLGLVSLWDAPRAESQAAVLAARRAHVRVLMLTGDHAATARAVAQAVGIEGERVVRGDELDLPDAQVDSLLAQSNVFARMRPEHKLRLIERLQASGEVVAMTGDGLNDAPALKRADVGVAMGARGSEVAREVADLVLLDDNFATIVAAIEEGRCIYANVLSFVRFSFSSNVALLILVLGSAAGSLFLNLRTAEGSLLLPFTALQILWINFLGDGPPALAIALDRSKDALLQPPRAARAPLLDASAARFVLADGLVKGGLGLVLLVLLPQLGASLAATATAVFVYEGIAKLLSMFPARRLHGALNPNAWVYGASAVSIAAQLSCMFVPRLRNAMGLAALSNAEIACVLLALAITAALGELLVRLLRGAKSAAGVPPGAGIARALNSV